MRNKITLIFLVALFFLTPTVLANTIFPISSVTTPFYPLFLILELILFWLFANKVFSIKVGFWKSLLIVAVANIITSLMGIFITNFLIGFILTVIFEYAIFLLFFIKKKVKRINLLWISLIVNIISYLILFSLFYVLTRFGIS